MYKIILASSSPRRRELLRECITNISFFVPQTKEIFYPKYSINENLKRIAFEKAKDAFLTIKYKKFIVIGADTSVFIGNEILGKPGNKNEAIKYLRKLSGQWHTVFTGLVILRHDFKKIECVVKTKVKIKKIKPIEISKYVETGEPMDKAGAYAIQGKGAWMVERINGSYTNVVGLPLTQCIEGIRKLTNGHY